MALSKGRTATVLGWICGLALMLIIGVIAGRATFRPPEVEVPTAVTQTYVVVDGAVGETASYPVTATWSSTELAVGANAGTVTTVPIETGSVIDSGDVLYSLDLKPVVVAKGEVPAFRDLSLDDKGADVQQVQQLMVDLNFATISPDGHYGPATMRAIKKWQKSLGVVPTGVITAGDIAFAEPLPSRVRLDAKLRRGQILTAGDVVLYAVNPVPEFSISVGTAQQNTSLSPGTEVWVNSGSERWQAQVVSLEVREDGGEWAVLGGVDGATICGDSCDSVPILDGGTILPGDVVLTPEASGPIVPLSTMSTGPDGSVFVRLANGTPVTVQVLATDGARSVVTGVTAGQELLLFADEAS